VVHGTLVDEYLVGWIIYRKQSRIEEMEESAIAHVNNVADLDGATLSIRSWVPQGMSERGMCICKLVTIDVIMSL
jgi:hypothetical protein